MNANKVLQALKMVLRRQARDSDADLQAPFARNTLILIEQLEEAYE